MDDDIDEIKEQKMEEIQEQDSGPEPEVEIFTTPTCPYCDKLKNWMDQEGIDYVEHDVASDREQAMRMIQKTGQQGVPQTFVGGEAIIGFQPKKIEAAFEG
ncbi:MAG: NrdH-redoxin [Candidatus Nanohaloarchaeota archaeon QJJ-7]|nr:NrdH-redoxin [Candidatus Nanohaloarchaeota archaeon QJJ-7]